METKSCEKKVEVFRGYRQMEAIIQEIMVEQKKAIGGRGFPSWDFVNGVLSCKEILGDSQLWFHWGKLLISRKEDRDEGKKAGEHEELDDWNTEADGTITLIGMKWRED